MMQKYHMYKQMLFICYLMNVFFLLVGAVALYSYLQTHDPTHLQLVFIAAGILVFGILLPSMIISHIMKKLEELKRQTERMVAEYISRWLETFEKFEDDEPLKNPKFWLTMGLMAVEVMGDHSQHPGVQALAEFAPILRRELKTTHAPASHTKTTRKKTAPQD